MSHTNGSLALNGNGHRPYTNGNDPYTLARLAKLDRIKARREGWKAMLVLIGGAAVAILMIGWFYYDLTHMKTPPDPVDAIEAQIDNIDLDQPKHDIRTSLDNIKSAVEELRSSDQYDSINEPLHP
jgi:uncharacterized membrane protein YvbJ